VLIKLVLFVSRKEKKAISEAVDPRIAAFYVSRRTTLANGYSGKEKKCWNESRGRLGRKEVDHDRRGSTSPRGILGSKEEDQTYLHHAQPKEKKRTRMKR
jgi:hypothetical protein